MIPAATLTAVADALGDTPQGLRPVGGGCINEAFQARLGGRTIFLKMNRACPPGMFSAEAAGLRALRATGTLRVPEPLAWSDDSGFLVLEYIDAGHADVGQSLGRGLAALHRAGVAEAYGFEGDNFIGSLPQANPASASWPEFFGQHRLQPQLVRARDSGALSSGDVQVLEAVVRRLPELVPARPAAALMHGDLWGGNYLVDAHGAPVLIDPAVYRGHREVELAFTELFGGFGRRFYAAYDEAWPLEPGYRERRDLYNAYPLLVHVNLFGGGYRGQLMSAVRRYS